MSSITGSMNNSYLELNPFEMQVEVKIGPEQPDEIEIEVTDNEMSETSEDADGSPKPLSL